MGGWRTSLALLLLWQLAAPAAAAPRTKALEGETVNMLDASVQLMQVRLWPWYLSRAPPAPLTGTTWASSPPAWPPSPPTSGLSATAPGPAWLPTTTPTAQVGPPA